MNNIQEALSCFRGRLLTFEMEGQKYLVSGISVEAAIKMGDEWSYLLMGYPVLANALENLSTHGYASPFHILVKQIQVFPEKVEAYDKEGNGKIIIYITDHQSNIAAYEAFQQALRTIGEPSRILYEHFSCAKRDEAESDFWYDGLWRISV